MEPALADQIVSVKSLFAAHFGGACNVVVGAPGRVNLIGEHTDYNEGFVMPFCIARHTVIAARRTAGPRCRVVSANAGGEAIAEFDADSSLAPAPDDDWTNYMRGVVAQYLPDLPGGQAGFEAAVLSSVPLGGGLSSSASLEVATATMLECLYRLTVDPVTKALRCQQCEHKFCNTPCGIMDQFVSACGQMGNALLIDCRQPYATEQVPLDDPNVALLIANSNVKHSLSGSEYPDRVRQCRDACAAMRAAGHTHVKFLRDATLEQLAKCVSLDAVTLRRARHGISEDQRTLRAKEALKAADYPQVGRLMLESHNSLKDDYEVSTPELDALVEIAMTVDGVYGSRMTGGGFGGCTVTLLRADALPALIKAIGSEYPKRCGKQATCFSTTPANGALVLQQGAGALAESGGTAPTPLRSPLSSWAPLLAAAAAGALLAVAASRRGAW